MHRVDRPRNRIEEIRKARAIRPVYVAAHLHVSESTLHRWESGKTTIRERQRFALADLLQVDVAYMMGYTDHLANGHPLLPAAEAEEAAA
jgi:transcriptional regulator with XRE-family HTH domain